MYAIHLDSSQEFYEYHNEDMNQRVIDKYQLPNEFGFFPANTWHNKNHFKSNGYPKEKVHCENQYGFYWFRT